MSYSWISVSWDYNSGRSFEDLYFGEILGRQEELRP